MSAAVVVHDLAARGVRVEPRGDRLHVEAPAGVLTAADREALRRYKRELLALLRQEPPPPAGPCNLCSTTTWWWAPDWPPAGAWLCQTCMRRPAPTLAQAFDGLSPDDRARPDAEAAEGDPLARAVLTEVQRETALDVATTIARALGPTGAGWVVIYSRVLGREVVLTRDETVPVPEAFASLPRFTRAELAELALSKLDAGMLAKIVETREVFGPGTRLVAGPAEPPRMR